MLISYPTISRIGSRVNKPQQISSAQQRRIGSIIRQIDLGSTVEPPLCYNLGKSLLQGNSPPGLMAVSQTSWKMRVALQAGISFIQVSVRQDTLATRPSVKVQLSTTGQPDIEAFAMAVYGWTTISIPVAVAADAAVWVEFKVNDAAENNGPYNPLTAITPCYWDNLKIVRSSSDVVDILTATIGKLTTTTRLSSANRANFNSQVGGLTTSTTLVPYYGVFSIKGNTLTGLTYSASVTVDSGVGSPPPSLSIPPKNYAYADAGVLPGKLITGKVLTNTNGYCCIVFGASSAGHGLMLHLEGNPSLTTSTGVVTASTWASLPTYITEGSLPPISPSVFHDLTISLLSPTAKMSLDGSLLYSTAWANYGTYLGLAGGGTGLNPHFQLVTVRWPTGAEVVADWVTRVATAGGATPSSNTQAALAKFYSSLLANDLVKKMRAIQCFVPDNLTAASVPFVCTYGNEAWTKNNFVDADLTVNGLQGNATNKYMTTGLSASSMFAVDNDCGLTAYAYTATNSGTTDYVAIGATNVDGLSLRINSYYNSAYRTIGTSDDQTTSVVVAASGKAGYYSVNRISSTDIRLYFANTASGHTQLGVNTTANTATRTSTPIMAFAGGSPGSPMTGTYDGNRYSFMAAHQGLTSTESALFYAAIRQLRVDLGGGYS